MEKFMVKRRTASSIKDIIGNDVRPGNIVAISVSEAYGASPSALRLVEVEHIYLDDAKGKPYAKGDVFFRDTATDAFHLYPTDEPCSNWNNLLKVWDDSNDPIEISDPSLYTIIQPGKNIVGSDYTGINEIVALQDYRIYGQPLSPEGTPTGKKSYYEIHRVILVRTEGRSLTAQDLASRVSD